MSLTTISTSSSSDAETLDYVGKPLHPAAKAAFTFFGVGVFLSGVFGNVLLLIVLASHRPLWQVHNIFIASLAVADLLVVALGLPHLILDLIQGYHPIRSEWHCSVYAFFMVTGFLVSQISLAGISLNRYLKVCHTSLYRRIFSVKKNACICASVWLIAFFANLPSLIGWISPFEYSPEVHVCGLQEGDILISVITVVCVMVICYSNFIIFRRWREVRYRLAGAQPQGSLEMSRGPGTGDVNESRPGIVLSNQTLCRGKQRASCSTGFGSSTLRSGSAVALVKSLLVVSLVFVVLFVQFVAVTVAQRLTKIPAEVILGSTLLMVANNAVNWIIYGAMNASFRDAYQKTLCRCRRS